MVLMIKTVLGRTEKTPRNKPFQSWIVDAMITVRFLFISFIRMLILKNIQTYELKIIKFSFFEIQFFKSIFNDPDSFVSNKVLNDYRLLRK